MKARGFIFAFAAFCAVSLLGAPLTRDTEWKDIPPEMSVGTVVDLAQADIAPAKEYTDSATNALYAALHGEIDAHQPTGYAPVSMISASDPAFSNAVHAVVSSIEPDEPPELDFAPSSVVARVEALEDNPTGPYLSVSGTGLVAGQDGKCRINFANRTITFDGGTKTLTFPVPRNSTTTLADAYEIGLRIDATAVRIGKNAGTATQGCIAIGYNANSTAGNAAQIGTGLNGEANSLQFLGWKVIDANGHVPADRLAPADLLTAIKRMDATQLAELKAFLGVE